MIDKTAYKIGMNEIKGLEKAMRDVIDPIRAALVDKMYWNEDLKFEQVEYVSRDGFWAHDDNFGGLQIQTVIPKCEEYNFDFIDFGECDCAENGCTDDGCLSEQDGHLDAALRIWFKFEGLNEKTGELSFYIYAGGGNGDAPYFRTKYEHDIFEASFTTKSLAGIKRAASKHVKALLKIINK